MKTGHMKLYEEPNEIIFRTQQEDPLYTYLTEKIFSALRPQKGQRLLDLGCGSGRNVFYAAKLGLTSLGVDYEPKAVAIGKEIAQNRGLEKTVSFVKADITELKKQQFGHFDYVILMEVIEHNKEYQKIIDFAHDSLKTGGFLMLTTPHDPRQWTILDDYAQHIWRFTIPQVRLALRRFDRVQIYTTGFPLRRAIVRAYDIILRSLGREHNNNAFRPNPLVGQIYFWIGTTVMMIDDLFTWFPFGNTIVAIAQK